MKEQCFTFHYHIPKKGKMDKKAKILLIDDEKGIRTLLSLELSSQGYKVETAKCGEEGIKKFQQDKFNVVVCDLKLPDISGKEILSKIKQISPSTEVIVMTGYGTIEDAVNSMKKGAYDFVSKPFNITEISVLIEKALEKSKLKSDIALYEASKVIFSTIEVSTLADIAVDVAVKIAEADDASLILLDKNGKLFIKASYKLEDEKKVMLSIGERVAELVAEKQKLVIFASDLQLEEMKSVVIYPLLSKNKQLLGMLTINRTNNQEEFTNNDLRNISIFTTLITQAVENATLYERLKESNEKLQELDDLKSEFVSNVSHELRTPLTSIKGSIDLLLGNISQQSSETIERLLVIARNNAERLVRLVSELLDFSRIETGKLQIDKNEINIHRLIDETVKELEYLATGKGLLLSSAMDCGEQLVYADYDRIKQVLVNLIGNAIKFTNHGQVIVGSELSDKEIKIFVKDTGCGIPEESKKIMFEKFYRVDNGLVKETMDLE